MSRTSLIAALSKDYVIGKNNELPWRLPEDMRLFKQLTTGRAVVMGRKTYDSILCRLGKPLPNRLNIVLSSSMPAQQREHVVVARTLTDALATADVHSDETFVIGGAQIYSLALSRANRMYLSWVDGHYDGDSFFPRFNERDWSVVERNKHEGFEHIVYDRRPL